MVRKDKFYGTTAPSKRKIPKAINDSYGKKKGLGGFRTWRGSERPVGLPIERERKKDLPRKKSKNKGKERKGLRWHCSPRMRCRRNILERTFFP